MGRGWRGLRGQGVFSFYGLFIGVMFHVLFSTLLFFLYSFFFPFFFLIPLIYVYFLFFGSTCLISLIRFTIFITTAFPTTTIIIITTIAECNYSLVPHISFSPYEIIGLLMSMFTVFINNSFLSYAQVEYEVKRKRICLR